MAKDITKPRITSYDTILEFLREKDQTISKYTGSKTFLLRDIIYYVNNYKHSTEPKITEDEVIKITLYLFISYLNFESFLFCSFSSLMISYTLYLV